LVTRAQLLQLGFKGRQIEHRVGIGRLHPIHRGVYALGRPELTRHGFLMAAVLACGPHAALSHESAAELWEIRAGRRGAIDVSVPGGERRSRPGINVHRQTFRDVTRGHGIPVTTVVATLVDLAARLDRDALEATINEAVNRDLTNPDRIRRALEEVTTRPGIAVLRATLDRRTFRVTRSKLERRFLRLCAKAGLPPPLTRVWLNGYEVDFWWPALGLVVETDSLRFHRTAETQTRDRLRDQAHLAAGLTPLRFTHYQVFYESDHVVAVLSSVARRLAA
jgi:very-short-patch-repair endonuclease